MNYDSPIALFVARQVYTQGLHRREFEVGYTHRRERALKEGEDASIELARQMQAQVCMCMLLVAVKLVVCSAMKPITRP